MSPVPARRIRSPDSRSVDDADLSYGAEGLTICGGRDGRQTMRILVLGAGFGGLELTSAVSEALGDDAEVTLIDKNDGFVFGFSKLDVMFGRAVPEQVTHPYADLVKPGVTFVQTTIRSIDPNARRVETDAGSFEAELMVVALGADLHPSATPGLVEAGHEFYTVPGAFALRETLAGFGGGRVVVGVTSTPFKCPPAPSETALLVHDFLVERGLREASEIALVMPLGVPIPPSPEASAALLEAFAEHDSKSVQHTLYAMGQAVLDGLEQVKAIRLVMPNKHHLPVDLSRLGLENRNEIFVPTEEPYGLIEATLTR